MQKLIFGLALTVTSTALAQQQSLVHWPLSAVNRAMEMTNGHVQIIVKSPEALAGHQANHSVFSCYATKPTEPSCNLKALGDIVDRTVPVQTEVKISQHPCRSYLCDIMPLETREHLTLQFTNGLILQSTVRILQN